MVDVVVAGVSVAVAVVWVAWPGVGVPPARRCRPQAPGAVVGVTEVSWCGRGRRHCVADQVGESGGGRCGEGVQGGISTSGPDGVAERGSVGPGVVGLTQDGLTRGEKKKSRKSYSYT